MHSLTIVHGNTIKFAACKMQQLPYNFKEFFMNDNDEIGFYDGYEIHVKHRTTGHDTEWWHVKDNMARAEKVDERIEKLPPLFSYVLNGKSMDSWRRKTWRFKVKENRMLITTGRKLWEVEVRTWVAWVERSLQQRFPDWFLFAIFELICRL